MRYLRFLNLLEPGKPVLSITKIALWLATLLSSLLILATLLSHFLGLPPFEPSLLLAHLGTQFSTACLYAWRRHVAFKVGSPGLLPDPPEEIRP